MKNLAEMCVGEVGQVRNAAGGLSQRLRDLGFTRGVTVKCLLAAPGCGMRAYRVRGAVIALRQRDARQVTVEEGKYE